MYHTYINNRYTDDQVRQMRSADSPSKTTENFITMDELSFLRKQIEKIQYPEEGKTSKYSGASYNDPIGQVLKKMFDKRIKNLIGDYDLDFLLGRRQYNHRRYMLTLDCILIKFRTKQYSFHLM